MKRFLYIWHIIILLGRVGLLLFIQKGGILPFRIETGFHIQMPSWSLKNPFLYFSHSDNKTGTFDTEDSGTVTTSIPQLINSSPLNQENASQHISLDSIMDNISPSTISSSKDFVTTDSLRTRYKTDPSSETATTLITQLSREFEYNEAYSIFKDLDYTTQHSLDPHLVLRILFNSSLLSDKNKDIVPIQSFIDQAVSEKDLTLTEQQRYTSLLGLAQGNMSGFLSTLQSLSPTGYLGDTIKTLQSRISQAKQGRDIPGYYAQGMLTLGLFEHGYITLSQQLSLAILTQYPNYTLPKQILGYTHIILKQRREAKAYFLDLIASDPINSSYYQFFVGVSSYWMNNYVDAVLYLTQISSDFTTSDVVRYKILSYIQLKDTVKSSKQFKELLGKTDLRAADFLLFWEQAIFEPYSSQSDYVLLNQDNTLLDSFLKRCKEGSVDKDVCILGEIGQQVILKQYYQLDLLVVPLIDKFPRAYLSLILAEIYTTQGKPEEAKKYLVRALSLTKEEKTKKYIKQKLQELL